MVTHERTRNKRFIRHCNQEKIKFRDKNSLAPLPTFLWWLLGLFQLEMKNSGTFLPGASGSESFSKLLKLLKIGNTNHSTENCVYSGLQIRWNATCFYECILLTEKRPGHRNNFLRLFERSRKKIILTLFLYNIGLLLLIYPHLIL